MEYQSSPYPRIEVMPKSEWGSIYCGSDSAKTAAASYFGPLADGYTPIRALIDKERT